MKAKAAVFVVLVGLVVLGTLAGAASAYDRSPVRLGGLQPDNWGIATTSGQQSLLRKYPGVEDIYCVGVSMIGYENDSSWVHGLTRYWDKLFCVGYVLSGPEFSLIYDAKGPGQVIAYRLHGVSIAALQG